MESGSADEITEFMVGRRVDVADGTPIQVPAIAVDGQLFYALAIVRG